MFEEAETGLERRWMPSRREALRGMGLLAVGMALTPVPGFPASWFRSRDTVVPFTDVPPGFTGLRGSGPETHPGENRIAQDLRELHDRITSPDDFFVVTHYGIPVVDPSRHTLRIGGLVERPITLAMDDLYALPRVERTTVFECGGNSRALLHGMVGNATWGGAELAPLLDRAGPGALAREAHFFGADRGTEEIRGAEYEQPFARAMSLEEIREFRPILAWEMNGEPLPVVHGFPVRLVVPGWYGVAQVKWLDRIEVSADRLMTRFQARDYVTIMGREVEGRTEWVETSVTRQRVKSVIARVTREDDRFTIFGAAWSDGTPLASVEVRVGDGPWRSAEIDRPADPVEWSFFRAVVTGLAPGEHRLVSRATDARGRSQPEDLALKRTRWENNELFHRTIEVA